MRLPDGRVAQLWVGGASGPTVPVVLVCHGTPDTRWVARTGEPAAQDLGVRLVCVNRPGYGASSSSASTMASVADDAVAVLDQLGVARFAVLGMSVGSAYAAALAAGHPDRVAALAVVAAPRETREATCPIDELVEEYRPEFEAWRATVDPADPDDAALAARWLPGLPEDDAALVARHFTDPEVAASVREALANSDGYLRDAALLFSPWGFDLGDIRCPAHLFFGLDDERNPPSNGEWWADRIPQAELTVTPTTHLATLLASWPTVLGALRAYLD